MASLAMMVLGCDSSNIISEDWGPPRGFAEITGTIRHQSGAPAIAHTILFSGCKPALASVENAVTDGAGHYAVRAWLSPGLPLLADTVHVTCSVVIDFASPPVDSLELAFSPDSLRPVRETLDLTIP